jgi:DNA (cytosine-5)-methyltransferase 1
MKKQRVIKIADLFCGAGGTSAGAVEAIEALGFKAELTAINHWDVAIATHTANHPDSRHLCTHLDNVDPRKLFKEGELDILWASPECTHHSVARGGKPINDQSRATFWCVVRWAEALRPRMIFIENVPEFESWGPIGSDNRPLKSRKGETFRAGLTAIESIGYKLDYGIRCAADYGDPTTRRRLFVIASRGNLKTVWPNATHASKDKMDDMFGARRSWRTARDHVIDWSLPGKSIYERKHPLSEKTMRRIWAGMEKFGLKPFVVPQQSNPVPKGVDEPLGAVVAEGSGPKLCEPMIITMEHGGSVRSADRPLPTVTTAKGGAMAVAQPFLVAQFGEREGQTPRTHDVDSPLPTVTAQKGGPGLVQPFLVPQQSGEDRVRSVDKPLQTVTTESRGIGLVDPYLVKVSGTEDRRPRSVDEPHPTVTAGGVQLGLAEPFIVRLQHNNNADAVDKPLGTVLAGGTHFGLAEPFLVEMKGTSTARSVEKPMPGVTTKQHVALAEPFLVHTAHDGERAALDTNTPLPTVAGNRGDLALIEPFVMSAGGPECPARGVSQPLGTVLTRDHRALVEPTLDPIWPGGPSKEQQEKATAYYNTKEGRAILTEMNKHVMEPAMLPQQSDGAMRPVSQPVPTVATAGAIGLVEPFLIEYYGNGTPNAVADPLPTVTCNDRHALVRPVVVIDGERYLLDIRFRMLQPHELAAAQGFRRDYKFTGTKTEQVKQIGNAVPRNLARALVLAMLSQNADITPYLPAEEETKPAAA